MSLPVVDVVVVQIVEIPVNPLQQAADFSIWFVNVLPSVSEIVCVLKCCEVTTIMSPVTTLIVMLLPLVELPDRKKLPLFELKEVRQLIEPLQLV